MYATWHIIWWGLNNGDMQYLVEDLTSLMTEPRQVFMKLDYNSIHLYIYIFDNGGWSGTLTFTAGTYCHHNQASIVCS